MGLSTKRVVINRATHLGLGTRPLLVESLMIDYDSHTVGCGLAGGGWASLPLYPGDRVTVTPEPVIEQADLARD